LTICNVTNDAKHKWPAFTELLSIVLKNLQDTLKLSLTHINMTDGTQLLQRCQQPNLQ